MGASRPRGSPRAAFGFAEQTVGMLALLRMGIALPISPFCYKATCVTCVRISNDARSCLPLFISLLMAAFF